MTFWLVFFALGAPSARAGANTFSLYNLSILLPLPKQKYEEAWSLKSETCGREILSEDIFAQVPQLVRVPNRVTQQYTEMRLVGLRFDPIAEETRLVFQPLIWAEWGVGEAGFWGEDAAIHLFFKTSKATIWRWQQQLRALTGEQTHRLLGVHPYFRRHGEMEKLDFVVCDLAEIQAFKLTFMNVRGRRVLWAFGGFELHREDETLKRGDDVEIPNAEGIFTDKDDAKMSVQRVAKIAGVLRAGLLPKPNRGDHLMATFNVGPGSNVENVPAVRRTLDRIENPELNSPKTVDCVSCHATEFTRNFLERRYDSRGSADEYPLTKEYGIDTSVSEAARINTANFRLFGYLDREAVVSRRVLNETIQTQRFLENWRPPGNL